MYRFYVSHLSLCIRTFMQHLRRSIRILCLFSTVLESSVFLTVIVMLMLLQRLIALYVSLLSLCICAYMQRLRSDTYYAHMFIYIHACIYTHVYIYIHICLYIYTHMFIHIHACIYTYAYIYTYTTEKWYTYVYTYTCVYIYICLYVYIYDWEVIHKGYHSRVDALC
jgi:hypothetical protein